MRHDEQHGHAHTGTVPAEPATYDVLVVGGGLVGATLALALKGAPVSVAVIEGREPAGAGEAFEPRVSAITQSTENMLRQLGAWTAIKAHRNAPFAAMNVWDAEGTGQINFSARESGRTHLGHIIENAVILKALWQQLREGGRVVGDSVAGNNVTLKCPASVATITRAGEQWRVVLNDGQVLNAALLIGADGANSMVRETVGFQQSAWSYQHHAIVATIKTEKQHGGVARQRFMRTGPLALLPLQDQSGDQHHVSLVWSTRPEMAASLMELADEAFCVELTDASEACLGDVEWVSQRYKFPLYQRHVHQYVKQGVALIGDAAHTIHPLAGQGVNLGFLDAAVLAEEIVQALRYHLPVGAWSTLRRYERRRKAHNLFMMSLMEGFKRLFEANNLPLRWLRNTGLNGLDRHPVAKHLIMEKAMFGVGDVPALAKPASVMTVNDSL